MAQSLSAYDKRSYDRSHPLLSTANVKVVGKFKNQSNGQSPAQFVGLRAKMYSLLLSKNTKSKMTVKEVQRGYVTKHVHHSIFLNTLHNKTFITAEAAKQLRRQYSNAVVFFFFIVFFFFSDFWRTPPHNLRKPSTSRFQGLKFKPFPRRRFFFRLTLF
jgi:hypothetical protein